MEYPEEVNMYGFFELTKNEQEQVMDIAKAWKNSHEEHIAKLVKQAEHSYAPSSSDCFHPELWKPVHWEWFSRVLKEENK